MRKANRERHSEHTHSDKRRVIGLAAAAAAVALGLLGNSAGCSGEHNPGNGGRPAPLPKATTTTTPIQSNMVHIGNPLLGRHIDCDVPQERRITFNGGQDENHRVNTWGVGLEVLSDGQPAVKERVWAAVTSNLYASGWGGFQQLIPRDRFSQHASNTVLQDGYGQKIRATVITGNFPNELVFQCSNYNQSSDPPGVEVDVYQNIHGN